MSQVSNEFRQDYRVEDAAVEPAPRSIASPLLWGLLLIVLAAAAAWWYSNRDASDTTVPMMTEQTMPALPPVEQPATVPRQAAPSANRTASPAMPQSRPARPLAGNVEPKYPPAALRSGIGGTVMVRAEIDADGQPVAVNLVERSGNRELDRAALNAVRQWRFEPAIRNGRATSSVVQVPVDFKPI
ncbi:energy transducer TonB [Pseudoxanthomonas mexicana]|uniref:energy transducer TonB n=1 Tax=Pseudoxanthomonas mexicana TaxID=128785 RepID=UPI00398AD6B0